jgi:short/branched chain acyl-CoA dehydrogenase
VSGVDAAPATHQDQARPQEAPRQQEVIQQEASPLSGAELAWQQRVAAFAAASVAPRAAAMDAAAELDPALSAELFAETLMAIQVPEAYGGAGRDLFQTVLAIEQLARHDAATAVLVDVQNALVESAVLQHGSGDQRRRFLPRLATGAVGAYALSEEESGSDALALATTAKPDGQDYRLTGRKRWATSAAVAEIFLVFARIPGEGIASFLIGRDAGGLTVRQPVPTLGIRASSTCDLVLEDVHVGREDMLGQPGRGDLIVIETLNVGRLGIAAQLVGLADGALCEALGYARTRRQFGQPVADFQGVSFPLARLSAELAAARAFLYDTTRMTQRGASPAQRLRSCAIAKLLASDVAERAAAQAVETLGGNGFTAAYGAERRYRDAKVGKIYEGTSNMLLRTIAGTQPSPIPATGWSDNSNRPGGG